MPKLGRVTSYIYSIIYAGLQFSFPNGFGVYGSLMPYVEHVSIYAQCTQCIRRHDSDVYLGMSLVQNGGSYLMY